MVGEGERPLMKGAIRPGTARSYLCASPGDSESIKQKHANAQPGDQACSCKVGMIDIN